jgi:hypothetical protein
MNSYWIQPKERRRQRRKLGLGLVSVRYRVGVGNFLIFFGLTTPTSLHQNRQGRYAEDGHDNSYMRTHEGDGVQ